MTKAGGADDICDNLKQSPSLPLDSKQDRVPSQSSELESASLWDKAYDSLKQDEGNCQIFSEYEKLLSLVPIKGKNTTVTVPISDVNIGDLINKIPQNDPVARRERLQRIAESGLEHLNDKKSKFTILGHEVVLQDGVAQVGSAIDWAQDFIKDAIKDVPYAPAVMAGIALVLPFFKNPAAVDAANRDGFIYVTSQMRYYGELESLLLPNNMKRGLKEVMTDAVTELYKLVIQFQIQSVIRFYRNGVKNYFRGVVNYDAWDSQLEHIKEEQARLEKMFENALRGTSIWDTNSGQCLNTLVISYLGFSVLLSGDSSILISPSLDRYAIDIWDVASGRCLHTMKDHTNAVYSVALLDSCPRLVASASFDGTVKMWNANSGKLLYTLVYDEHVFAVAFSGPQSKLLALSPGRSTGTIHIWDAFRGTCQRSFQVDDDSAEVDAVDAIAFSEDENLLISRRTSGLVKIWDLGSGQCLHTIKYYESPCLSFGSKERTLAVSSNLLALPSQHSAGHWQVYNTSSGKCLHTLDDSPYGIGEVAFSQKADLIATSRGNNLKIWDSGTGQCLYTLGGHGGSVGTVSFSHDSKIVASSSSDNTVNIWDISTHHSRDTTKSYTNIVHGGLLTL
ncbi:hypothetical protein N7540_008029 [Penicillium herquei]|nr:hypothetical protein N7540_008029 [Penicillium herquei]